jgi:hypothetical protein
MQARPRCLVQVLSLPVKAAPVQTAAEHIHVLPSPTNSSPLLGHVFTLRASLALHHRKRGSEKLALHKLEALVFPTLRTANVAGSKHAIALDLWLRSASQQRHCKSSECTAAYFGQYAGDRRKRGLLRLGLSSSMSQSGRLCEGLPTGLNLSDVEPERRREAVETAPGSWHGRGDDREEEVLRS